MKRLYSKEFFRIQIDFATALAQKHSQDLDSLLFTNTSLYTRIIGHNDEHPPLEDLPEWVGLIKKRPKKNLTDYFYEAYLSKERERGIQEPVRATKPCFHAYHHEESNKYELHLDVNDPKGILSKERVAARTEEIRKMLGDIRDSGEFDSGTVLYVRSWLLNIDSFNRLFPLEFSHNARPWKNENKTQDNSHWGQFVDRNKNIKHDLVGKFEDNYNSQMHEEFNDYFPLKALYSDMKISDLLKYYEL